MIRENNRRKNFAEFYQITKFFRHSYGISYFKFDESVIDFRFKKTFAEKHYKLHFCFFGFFVAHEVVENVKNHDFEFSFFEGVHVYEKRLCCEKMNEKV